MSKPATQHRTREPTVRREPCGARRGAPANAAHPLLALQQKIGNQAVLRLMRDRPRSPGSRADPSSASRPVIQRQRREPHDAGAQPAPPAPASARSAMTIQVDFISLQGVSRDPASDLRFANSVFSACGVVLTAGRQEIIPTVQAINFIGIHDTIDCGSGGDCPATRVSRQERSLFDFAAQAFPPVGRIRVFYVPEIRGAAAHGYSLFSECALGEAARYLNHAVIEDEASTRTFAHELGHILLNSGEHEGLVDRHDSDNLMMPSSYATGSDLDLLQCAIITGRPVP